MGSEARPESWEDPGSMECLERWQLLVIEEASSRLQYLAGLGKRTEGQTFYFLSTVLSVKILLCVKFRNQALKGKGREGRSYTQAKPKSGCPACRGLWFLQEALSRSSLHVASSSPSPRAEVKTPSCSLVT